MTLIALFFCVLADGDSMDGHIFGRYCVSVYTGTSSKLRAGIAQSV
jgi:hypothetical protein